MPSTLTPTYRRTICCPKCGTRLHRIRLRQSPVHRCPTGCGTWLEQTDLDRSSDPQRRPEIAPARDVAPPRAIYRPAI